MLNAKSRPARHEMRLLISAGNKSVTCDWTLCSLLRDNVQHHLEGGKPSGNYPAIHALGDVVWNHEGKISVRQLRLELDTVRPVLRPLSINKLAVGIRSRAALTGALTPPPVRGTVLLRLAGWGVPVRLTGFTTLGDLFGPTFDALQDVGRVTSADAELAYKLAPPP
jgi:hypothetical protein